MFGDPSNPEDVHERLLAAAFRFERDRDVALGEFEIGRIVWAGFDDVSSDEITNALVTSFDEVVRPAGLASTGYWVLGKLHSNALRPFFTQALRYETGCESESAYQLLIALDNLNEPVFGQDRNGSYSATETELNLRDARNFLTMQNQPAI